MITELHRLLYPEPIATTGFSTINLTGTTIKAMHMVNVPKSGNLTHIAFRTVAVTAPETINIRLETLNSIGEPTGTLIDASATASQAAPAANTNYEVALAAPVAVTKNAKIAIVYECPAGAPNVQIARLVTPFGTLGSQPYTGLYNGATWAKQATIGICALKYDDGTYPYLEGCYPPMVMAATNFNNTTVAFDEAGNLFTVPFQCQVAGFWVYLSTALGAFDHYLYDTSNNVLATVTDTSLIGQSAGAAVRIQRLNTPVILEPNTQYRQTIKSTNATNIASRYMTFDSAAIQSVVSGSDDFVQTQRKGAGAWAEVTNRRSIMGLIIDGINESGSTGKFKVMTAGGLVDIS